MNNSTAVLFVMLKFVAV